MIKLTRGQRELLAALHAGAALRVHRTLDGAKQHWLHPLAGDPVPVDRELVESLAQRGLIASNMKFPAATYLLTDAGLAALVARPPQP